MSYLKGQRVHTPYGQGAVVGFERFNQKGTSDPLSDVDEVGSTSRVVVELDHKHAWNNGEWGNPYMTRSDIRSVEQA